LTEAVIDYALDDVKYLSIIKRKQMELVKKYNLETAVKLDNNFVKVLAYVEFCGIGFDQPRWLNKCSKDEADWAAKEQELNDLVIADDRLINYRAYGSLFDPPGTIVCKMNWKSPKQVQAMFKKIGVDVEIESDGDMKDSVGVQVLQKNKDKPIVQAYAEYIKLNKRITSFGRDYLNFVNPNTNRIHTTYQQILNTGRMSSGNAKQGKPNLQQVPNNDEHRGCFIAEPGNKLICADYTGQEAVIFANKCLDKNLLAFYDGNLGDMHAYVAKLCFPEQLGGLDLKEIKKQFPDLRQRAKAAGFAIQFGGVGYTISNNLGISEDEGNAVYKAYTEAFPEMFDYFKKVSSDAKDLGYVTFNGLTKRKFFFDFMPEFLKLGEEINKDFWTKYKIEKDAESLLFENVLRPKVKKYFKYKGILERTSYNYPVQGTAADCTKYGSYLFFDWLVKEDLLFKVKIVNVVHDELIVECPEEMVELIKYKVKYFLELAGQYFCKRVPLFAEPQVAEKWVH
jgi:DNA polymerase-1